MNIRLLSKFTTVNQLDLDITEDKVPDETCNVYEDLIYSVKNEVDGNYDVAREFAKNAMKKSNDEYAKFASQVMLIFTEVRLDLSEELNQEFETLSEKYNKLKQSNLIQGSSRWFNFHFFSATYHTAYSTFSFYRSQYQDAIDANKKAIIHWEEIDADDGKNLIMIDLQFCYTRTGEFDLALESSDELFKRLDIENDKLTFCHALLSRSEILKLQANYEEAAQLLERANKIAYHLNNEALVFHSSRFLAKIYAKQGLYNQALDLQEQALDYFTEAENHHFISLVWNDLGVTARLKGDHNNAETYLEKSIEHSKKIGTHDQMLTSYYHLILNEIASNRSQEKLNHYLKEIDDLSELVDNPRYRSDLPKLSKALIFKTSKRLEDKFLALSKLRSLAKQDDLYYEYMLTTVYHLLELLLLEYNLTQEEIILEDVHDTFEILFDIGSKMNSYPVLIDYYILRAKFEKERGRKKLVLQYIEEAKGIANKSGVEQIIKYISNQEKGLKNELEIVDNVNIPELEKIMEFGSVSSYLKDLQDGKVPSIKPISLDPMILMINSQGGLNLYSREFEPAILSEINLVSSFLSAMISFSQVAFRSNSSIEMIKIGSQNLVLQLVDELVICFIYRGHTPTALERIGKLNERLLEENEIMEELKQFSISNRTENKLAKIVNKVFSDLL